jgi:uncharacterized repeat protein (TIGR01451 family)
MRSRPFAALFGLMLSVGAAASAQAASFSATGPVSVTVSGADTAMLGMAYPVTIVASNATPTTFDSQAQVNFATPFGAQLQGAIFNSTGGACGRVGGGSNGALVVCPLTGLAPGASATLTFTLVPQTLGTLGVSVAGFDAGVVSSTGLQVPVAPAPTDVQVTGSASTGSPALGSTFSYTYQVKDNGPWPAPGVILSDSLPASVGFVGVTTSTGSCTQTAGTVSCMVGDLAVGSQATVTISVQAPGMSQSITNTATVASGATDRQPSNNTVSVTVQTR